MTSRFYSFASICCRTGLVFFLDYLEPLKGPLSSYGYVRYELNYDYFDYSKDPESLACLIRFILSDFNVSSAINSYLLLPRLDQIRILKSPLTVGNRQSLWHHDSVGHRLKLYFGLDYEVNHDVFTQILPGTHNNRYPEYLESRISLTNYESTITPVDIPLGFNDIFIFDTNAIHRGFYSLTSCRCVLELEFSSSLRGILMPGKIGRKNYKRPMNLLNNPNFRRSIFV